MAARAVVLWRHGRTAYNAAARLQGHSDIPLDDVGAWQVAEAAQHIAQRHTPARIVSSDLGRAVATARALGELADVPVDVDPRLRERGFGTWEGLTAAEIEERWPDAYAVWRQGKDPQRAGAETRAEVAERMVEAVSEHAAALDDGGTLVVVSHGAAITLGLVALLGLDPAAWRGLGGLHNAHWSLLRASHRDVGPAWYVEAHNHGPAVAVDDWNAGVPADAMPSSTADAMRT
ncbi:histidine phosphatase family protein [Actinotalea ferrariae]|uniref:histidine phosphatase family protein n=1 Tax=Actinotalea ferrariae TaxID=1386098 RepID=UPI001C8BAC36|nr:histidine phosphatase family protein [Actinotalea ferrariae]MBX9246076.1 histidine phosphatase family protein [Actinotalea ferrariae]